MPGWWNAHQFTFGAVGASAAEIYRLYRIATGQSRAQMPKFTFWYILFSLLWAGLAGMFAIAWGEDNAWKCLWIGLSLPVTISALAAKPPPGTTPAPGPQAPGGSH